MVRMQLSQESKIHAQILCDGIIKTIKNADGLFDEARLLAAHGHVARAYLLHQISLEECGKAQMLFASLTSVLIGRPVDLIKQSRDVAQHKAKNEINAYYLPMSEAEEAAAEQGDEKARALAFDQMKKAFHTNSNGLKNAALYVDFDGTFKSPNEAISKASLDDVLTRNREFMSMAMDKLRVLRRWGPDLEAAAQEVDRLWTVLHAYAIDRTEPETLAAFKTAMDDMLEGLANPQGLPGGTV